MTAILSTCGTYRFRLERDIGPTGPVVALFGVNPSTADATINDATIRKEIGFAKRYGWRKIIKGNLHPFRATDVKELADHILPTAVVCMNDFHVNAIIQDADILIPCWGRLDKLPKKYRLWPEILMLKLIASGKPVLHFGKTKCSQPKHPLMLGYDTPIVPWNF